MLVKIESPNISNERMWFSWY